MPITQVIEQALFNGSSVPELWNVLNPAIREHGFAINSLLNMGAADSTIINVTTYGADPTGATDSTAAVAAAVTAIGASGGILFFPTGIYKLGTINIANGMSIRGAGTLGTTIRAKDATGNVFNVTAERVEISDMAFDAAVTRTAGAYVHFNTGANRSSIRNFYMSGYYTGVQITAAATVRARDATFVNGATTAGSAGILVDGGNDHYIDSITMDAPNGSQPKAGIQITQSGATQISNVDIVHHTECLLINPGNGQDVSATYVTNSFFDTAVRGIMIDPQGTGIVREFRAMGCWTSTMSQQGVLVNNAGTGARTGISFVDHHSFANAVNGLHVEKGNDVRVLGGIFAHNTGDGIVFAANVNEFSVIGARCGPAAGFNANSGWGINVIAGTSNNYQIINNDVRGNTTGSISDAGTGATKNISANLGYNPVGASAITVTASPFTYTAGGSPETVYIIGGTITAIAVGAAARAVDIATKTVNLEPGDIVKVTYTAAPTMEKYIH